MWAEPADDARLLRSSRVQVWLFLALTLVVAAGSFGLLAVSGAVGLYVSPMVAQLGRGTFDYINVVFVIMWAWMFQLLSTNDGVQYQLQVRKARPPRSRATDVWGFIGFLAVAVVWGVVGVHAVFAARSVDPFYVDRLPPGVPAESLQHGAVVVTAAYFVLIGLLLTLIVIARRFNPIDFGEYDRYIRRVLHLPTARESVR
jgi:hypothetical protein